MGLHHGGMDHTRPRWSSLGATCACGAVRADIRAADIWGGFVCHCGSCQDAEKRTAFGGGAPWVAVPRLKFDGFDPSTLTDALEVRRTSPFASRGACTKCECEIFIHYDCEAHTDWVHADVFGLKSPEDPKLGELRWSHIHHVATALRLGDGIPTYPGFEPWVPDPCRPANAPVPAVCMQCFQKVGCVCNGEPEDSLESSTADSDIVCLYMGGRKGCEDVPSGPWCLQCRCRLGDDVLAGGGVSVMRGK